MHKLLERQLRRCFGDFDPDRAPALSTAFLELVDEAYRIADAERAQLEHSMDTMSQELMERQAALKDALAQAKSRGADAERTLSVLRATLESTDNGVLAVTDDGVALANGKFTSMWGVDEDDLADRAGLVEAMARQIRESDGYRDSIRRLDRDPSIEIDDVLTCRDGRIIERTVRPQMIDGKAIGRVTTFRDVTHGRRLEEQFRQAQKMEALGQLAGGVAHDFNNLLTVIIGHAEALREDDVATPDEEIGGITDAAVRASELTRQLLAFSRGQVLDRRVVDVNDVVRHVMPMLMRLLPAHITLNVDLHARELPVLLDRNQIEQCLVNLAVNARDAMPDGGSLTFRTATAGPDDSDGRADPHAILVVADTGTGITPEVIEHIFEPFFTTKEEGRGTGLGLATTYGIIEQSGGQIEATSQLGVGTTFTIRMPIQTPVAPPLPGPAAVLGSPAAVFDRPAAGGEVIPLIRGESQDRFRARLRRALQGHISASVGTQPRAGSGNR